MAISLLAMFVVSCTNDDIEITKGKPKYNITFNINTENIYINFDIREDILEDYLRDKSRAIGIQTYLYDQNGNLIDSKITTQFAYNVATQTFAGLVEGTYTVVAVETLVNPDVDNVSEDWSVKDIEKLSTFKIKSNGPLGWASILGVTTLTINLSDDMEMNIEPEAIGARVNFYCYNFGNASYEYEGVNEPITNLGLATTDVLDYYCPNPQLSRKDRFFTDLTSKGITNVRTRMTPDIFENGYNTFFYIVESNVTWLYSWQFESTDGWFNFDSSNISSDIENGKTYYAGFYYMGGKHLPKTFFGGAKDGLTKWKTECDNLYNSIPPSISLYTTPYTNWSVGTVSAVKSYMANFDLYKDIQYDEIYEAYNMTYFDDSVNMYDYVFTSSTKGLTDVYVWPADKYTLSQVREEVVNQGYTYHSQNGNNYYYTSNSTYVTIYQSDSGWIMVNYYDPKAYGGVAPQKAMLKSQVNSKLQIKRIHHQGSLSRGMSSEGLFPFINNTSNVSKAMEQVLPNRK